MSARDKLTQLPDPSVIATTTLVEDKVRNLNVKIDNNNQDTKESLKRIEGKIDSLMLTLATRREMHLKDSTTVVPVRPILGDSIASVTPRRQ